MNYDNSADSFAKDVKDLISALLVGTLGVTAMLGLFALLQFCVTGEVTLFSDNFWFKEAQP